MENKKVGILIISLGIIMSFIIFIFNIGLKKIVEKTCDHGPTCSMYDTISLQTGISLTIVLLVISIGIFIIFSKQKEKIIEKTIIKKIKEKKKPLNLEGLNKIEKQTIDLIIKENGVIFQADLKEKLQIGKVGMTRLLDKLESKQLIERKRRGMNNIVVLKNM